MPVEARQAELRIVEEAGADLDGEAVDAGHIGGLHVDLAAMLGDVEPQDRRHRHRAWSRARGRRPRRRRRRRDRAARCVRSSASVRMSIRLMAASTALLAATIARCSAMSMLRPESDDDGRSARLRPCRRAARRCRPRRRPRRSRAPAIGMADAGGDLVLATSRTTSSSRSRHMAKVSRLSRPMPPPSESASVASSSTCTGRPASRLACIAAPRAIETPIDSCSAAACL